MKLKNLFLSLILIVPFQLGRAESTAKFDRTGIIVKFKTTPSQVGARFSPLSTGIASINERNRRLKIKGMRPLFSHAGPRSLRVSRNRVDRVFKLNIEEGAEVEKIVADFRKDPNVEYAEPNYIYKAVATATINDPDYAKQWALPKVAAPAAWGLGIGDPSVVIAVIDTGIDETHPDLKDRLWSNSGEIPNNGIDDDRNGHIDDTIGWNFVADNKTPKDLHGHGTHCAGIIAAQQNNQVGISGLAPGCRIMVVKGLDDDGSGYIEGLAASLIYAADNGARVISNSWGGSQDSQLINDAVTYAQARGAVVVAATGNDGVSSRFYPAAVPGVIAVGATDENDRVASFSNYGVWADVMAPGVAIYSTLPTYECLITQRGRSTSYDRLDGTSMACPAVSALAALIFSHLPTRTAAEVVSMIENGTDNIDALNPTYKGLMGFGRINALKSLQAAPTSSSYLIEGRVHDKSSQGVSHVLVQLQGEKVTSVMTGADGSFKFENLMKRNYRVIFKKPGTAFTSTDLTYFPLASDQPLQNVQAEPVGSIETVAQNKIINAEPSLTIDSRGRVNMTYIEGDFSHLPQPLYTVNYAIKEPQGWVTTAVANAEFQMMALDSHDQAHICLDNRSALTYIRGSGSSWSSPIPIDAGRKPFIAIDRNDQPHIAYDSLSTVKYARWNGSGWVIETLARESFRVSPPRLIFDSAGEPLIVYAATDDSEFFTIKLWRKINGVWTSEIIDEGVGLRMFERVNLTIDSQGQLAFIYSDFFDIKMAVRSSSGWTKTYINPVDRIGGDPVSALDKNIWHVAYTGLDTAASEPGIFYQYKTDSSWTSFSVEQGSLYFYPAMIVPPGSSPVLVYYNYDTKELKMATLTIAPKPNRAPITVDDNIAISKNRPLSIRLLDNDRDPDSDLIKLTQLTQPAHGSVSIVSAARIGYIDYTPQPGFKGLDSFTYQVSDEKGEMAQATVRIYIGTTPPVGFNWAPEVRSAAYASIQDQSMTLTLLARDVEKNALTYFIDDPQNGSVVFKVEGKSLVVYTPKPGFVGKDSFMFRVYDGQSFSEYATIKITVNSKDPFPLPTPTPQPTSAPIRRAVDVVAADLKKIPPQPASINYFEVGRGQQAEIRFELDQESPVDIEIADRERKLIRHVHYPSLPMGRHAEPWNGRSDEGQMMGSGLYQAIVRSGGRVINRIKLVMIR